MEYVRYAINFRSILVYSAFEGHLGARRGYNSTLYKAVSLTRRDAEMITATMETNMLIFLQEQPAAIQPPFSDDDNNIPCQR